MFDRKGWFEQTCLEEKLAWKAPADLKVSRFKVLPVVQSSCRKGLQDFWPLLCGAGSPSGSAEPTLRGQQGKDESPTISPWIFSDLLGLLLQPESMGFLARFAGKRSWNAHILLWAGVRSGLLGSLHLALSRISLCNRQIPSTARCWRKRLLSQLVS